MAIVDVKTQATSWEGRVLSTETKYNVQVMSDVWVDRTVAVVWDCDCTREIPLSDTEWGEERCAFVDATPDILAKYQEWEAKKAAKAAQDKAKADALALSEKQEKARLEAEDFFDRGDRVRVVGRRGWGAPPLGTEGEVTWTGVSEMYGTKRVGFKDSLGEVRYTARTNVKRVFDDPPTNGDWVSFLAGLKAGLKAGEAQALLSAPKKGTEVFLKADPSKKGNVFWVSPDGKRVGFKPSKEAEPIWADVQEILVSGAEPLAELPAEPPAELPAEPPAEPLAELPQRYEIPRSRVEALPAPLCDIASAKLLEGGVWGAFSAKGVLVMHLTEDTVRKLAE